MLQPTEARLSDAHSELSQKQEINFLT